MRRDVIGETVADAGLRHIREALSRVDICDREPRTYADVGVASLGHVSGAFRVSEPKATDDGRAITVAGGAEAAATRQGRPQYWAMTGRSQLLATGPLDGKPVAPGVLFRLPELEVEICTKEDEA
jgi:hypothetical protein